MEWHRAYLPAADSSCWGVEYAVKISFKKHVCRAIQHHSHNKVSSTAQRRPKSSFTLHRCTRTTILNATSMTPQHRTTIQRTAGFVNSVVFFRPAEKAFDDKVVVGCQQQRVTTNCRCCCRRRQTKTKCCRANPRCMLQRNKLTERSDSLRRTCRSEKCLLRVRKSLQRNSSTHSSTSKPCIRMAIGRDIDRHSFEFHSDARCTRTRVVSLWRESLAGGMLCCAALLLCSAEACFIFFLDGH